MNLLQMKNLKRIILGLFFGAIIAYLIFLILNGVVITNENLTHRIYFIYGLLLCIFLYYMICYVIKPIYIRGFKVLNTFISIFVIIFSQMFIINSGIEKIYYGDIFTLIGVCLFVIGFSNALVSPELKKEKEEKKMEIIEA